MKRQTLVAKKKKTAPRKNQHQDAVEKLRKKIQSGEYQPGQRLNELMLTRHLRMSRTPIREACRTLEGEGLVTITPESGVRVAELDIGSASDVFRVLGVLEGLAGELACERMTDEQLEELAELQNELSEHFHQNDRAGYVAANRLIHELIVTSAGNHALLVSWRLNLPRAERARQLSTLDEHRWGAAFGEHVEMLKALQARDGRRARRVLEEHFLNGITAMKKAERAERAELRAHTYSTAKKKA